MPQDFLTNLTIWQLEWASFNRSSHASRKRQHCPHIKSSIRPNPPSPPHPPKAVRALSNSTFHIRTRSYRVTETDNRLSLVGPTPHRPLRAVLTIRQGVEYLGPQGFQGLRWAQDVYLRCLKRGSPGDPSRLVKIGWMIGQQVWTIRSPCLQAHHTRRM